MDECPPFSIKKDFYVLHVSIVEYFANPQLKTALNENH